MTSTRPAQRLVWVDVMKAVAILWIVYFHLFEKWTDRYYPWPLDDHYFAKFVAQCAPTSAAETFGCVLEACLVAVILCGWHAVAVFLVLSGFGLTFSLARTGRPTGGWLGWYKSRLVRLFPMYWLAHLVYLVSPFVARDEPIDYRFWLSFLGDRVWPIDSIFYYFNPALWFFGLLLQLYLVFPLLFLGLVRLGPGAFLALSAAITVASRWTLLYGMPMNGYWVQGGFFGARLFEFALGMALGLLFRRDAEGMAARLFSRPALGAAAAVYGVGLYAYGWSGGYVFTDALTGAGLFVILAWVSRGAAEVPALGTALAHLGLFSYGLYLLHQPYIVWFAVWGRSLSGTVFLASGVALIAALAVVSSEIERRVNALVGRILPG